MTIQQAIIKLTGLPDEIGMRGTEIMKEEFAKGRKYATGLTEGAIHYERENESSIFIGVSGGEAVNHAYWVQYGRGDVYPVRKEFLAWDDPFYGHVVTRHARPAKADDFCGRTAARLRVMSF